jgi:hypothetical protein
MSEELSAISKIPPPLAARSDYDSICAALMDTERGRWFLQEYARRNRSADTKLLLTAIERIEAVVCAERSKQAPQDFRSDLLEMASAITRTRAEVAEIRSDAAARPESAQPDGEASLVPRPRDVFAAAERIRDVTWAMRGHGFDPSTCDQLEELAAAILSASALRDPTDHRASKLSEVLQYLERRIDSLLESCADGEASAPESAPEPDRNGFELAPNGNAGHENGFASALISENFARNGAEIKFHGARVVVPDGAVPDDVEGSAAARPSAPAVEIALRDVAFPPPVDPAREPQGDAESSPISVQDQEDGARIADLTAQLADHPVARPLASPADHAVELGVDAVLATIEPTATASPHELAAVPAEPPKRDAFLPSIQLPGSRYELPKSAEVQAASTALREAAARAFLPQIDLRSDRPGFNVAPAGDRRPVAAILTEALGAVPEPAQPPVGLATDVGGKRFTALGPAEPAGLETASPAPDQQPSRATSQPAAAPMPQPSGCDPLAALKAMSDDELIALFS